MPADLLMLLLDVLYLTLLMQRLGQQITKLQYLLQQFIHCFILI